MKTQTENRGDTIIDAMIAGYGPKFKHKDLYGLFAAAVATPEDTERLTAAFPAQGRYHRNTKFLKHVTSSYALGRIRYRLFAEKLIWLAKIMKRYNGVHKNRKIIRGLTRIEERELLLLGDHIDFDVLAEMLEDVTEHDTAAYADAFKFLIYRNLPQLRDYIEAVHFMDTSEDNWGNTVGLMLSELVFGHSVSAYLRLCESLLNHASEHEHVGIWQTPPAQQNEQGMLILPAFTHWQTATPTTYIKKVTQTVSEIVKHLYRLTDGERFLPFSGKFGGITGNYDAHFAAYRDIDWFREGRRFIEGLGLEYDPLQNQCASFATEAMHFRTLQTVNSQIIKFAKDFRFYVSCPGQLFIKPLKAGQKGSSSSPAKTNLWQIEGRFLRKHSCLLGFLADELTDYAGEGDMGRSGLMRDVGNDFSNLFIAVSRISRELSACVPNAANIRVVFEKYPGMCMSAMQYVLKREGYLGDAYRAIQGMVINPDGSYATRNEFMPRFQQFINKAGFSPRVRRELMSHMDPIKLVQPIHRQAKREMARLRSGINALKQIQLGTQSLRAYFEKMANSPK